ncbi:Bax inhibitor-1/YccA family membrane protein [Microbacterium excoecariae]|uniref:Bax inhibitor-1/YccA family protein n=1 Tax=Microbacterium excoecariae TaxID=2715210 RepID=UPI00140AB077|nr:Bax inhibitor-1/YccA family protein [Microbacterium excoecariae]NHI17631.1 Bax inhibitor-1/YccA family protein [Microbacterium excoecariae]
MASAGFNNPYFTQDRAPSAYPTPLSPDQAAQQRQAAQAPHAGEQAHIEGMYAAPSAGTPQTGRMTYEDTIVKTAILFVVMLAVAAVSWIITLGGSLSATTATSFNMVPMIVGALGTLVISLVIAFKKTASVGLVIAYAVVEGLFVGGISAFFEFLYPGIVIQAALASVAVIATTLALFANGKIRASARMTKIVLIAMIGYAVFSLLNVVLMMFGVFPEGMAFGLRSAEIFGIPLGLILGVVVVLMGAYMLVLDFDAIQRGVRNGAPAKLAWQAAYGILATVVFIYIEILRMIAILRGSD